MAQQIKQLHWWEQEEIPEYNSDSEEKELHEVLLRREAQTMSVSPGTLILSRLLFGRFK